MLPDWGPRGGGRRGRTGGGRFGGLDPVTHYANRHSIDSIIDFFGIKPSLPLYRQLVARSPPDMEKPKRLYFVASGLRDLLQVDEQEQLKVTACGLKILERQEFKVHCMLEIAGMIDDHLQVLANVVSGWHCWRCCFYHSRFVAGHTSMQAVCVRSTCCVWLSVHAVLSKPPVAVSMGCSWSGCECQGLLPTSHHGKQQICGLTLAWQLFQVTRLHATGMPMFQVARKRVAQLYVCCDRMPARTAAIASLRRGFRLCCHTSPSSSCA